MGIEPTTHLRAIEAQLAEVRDGGRFDIECFRREVARYLLCETSQENPDETCEEFEKLIYTLVNDASSHEEVGADPLGNPDLLACLVDISQSDWADVVLTDVALVVANNPNCSRETLSVLATIDNAWARTSVRICVACNPTTPADILEFMWTTIPDFEGNEAEAEDLVWCLAMNSQTPPHVLASIAANEAYLSGSTLAINPDGDETGESLIVFALAQNPSIPRSSLEDLYRTDLLERIGLNPRIADAIRNIAEENCHQDLSESRSAPTPQDPRIFDLVRWRFFWLPR